MEFLALKDKEWYQHRIKELTEKWFQTMQYDGRYFEF